MIIDKTSGDSELDELRRQVKQAEVEREKHILRRRLLELKNKTWPQMPICLGRYYANSVSVNADGVLDYKKVNELRYCGTCGMFRPSNFGGCVNPLCPPIK